MKRSVNDKLVSSQGPEGGLQRTKERHGGAEIAGVYFLLWLATPRRGSIKGRQEKKSDQHHHCSLPNLIVQDPEHMLVYIRGTENPSCDSYGAVGVAVGVARLSGRTCQPASC